MRIISLSLALAVIVFSGPLAELRAAPAMDAFSYVTKPKESVQPSAKAQDLAASVGWQIKLNQNLKTLRAGRGLTLSMPNGELLEVRITSTEQVGRGDFSLFGEFGDDGSLVMTIGKAAVYGTISSHDMHYSISQMSGDTIMLFDAQHSGDYNLEADYRLPPRDKNLTASQTTQKIDQLSASAEKSSEVTTVDFLAVYSPEFAAIFPSPATKVMQLVNFTNDSLARSGVLMQLRLVEARQLDFDNSASIGTNLSAATFATGSFTGLPQIRDSVGADMVAVLHGSNSNSASGVAWVNGDSAAFAFSSTRLSPICCESVFAHEIGHNLGSGHEHAAVNPNASDPCEGFFLDFACGHGASDQSWGTVMSRLNDGAIGFRFSNLDFDCLGERCGVPEGQANPADNRRAFNMSRLLIENFRPTATNSCTGLLASSACWVAPINGLLLGD